jgi:hypothetical protein
MKELHEIIDAKDFEALQGGPPLPRTGFLVVKQYGQLIGFQVKRGNDTQTFAFVDPNGQTSSPAAIITLQKWIRGLKPDKSEHIKKATPTLCPLGR